MTRQIKFRGLVNDGTWSYGVPVKNPTHDTVTMVQRITDDDIICSVVDPDTVGEFTGKHDVDGTKILDGDILEYCNIKKYPHHPNPYLVEWDDDAAGFKCENADNYMLASVWSEMRIIGNRFENPELAEVCK